MTSDTRTSLAPRRTAARVGAVEEYSALHRAALEGLVQHGLEAAAATVRLRSEARRLTAGITGDGATGVALVPFVAETEAAIAEVHHQYRELTVHVLRMARYRLGLC
jgi:hypothetical protein